MTSVLQIKFSWFRRHLILIFFMCCNIWKSVETIGKIEILDGNVHHFENTSRLNESYFANKIEQKHLNSVPREIRMSPAPSSKLQFPPFIKQNYANSLIKKNTGSQGFRRNFSGKYKSNFVDAHKMNFNADSSIINPGDFYRKYFSMDMKHEQNNPSNLKFKNSSPQLLKRKILNDGTMPKTANVFDKSEVPNATTYVAQKKSNFSDRKNLKVLSENGKANNEVLNARKISSEMSSKVLKLFGGNLQNKKVVHLKKKAIVTKWRDERTGAEKKSKRLDKLFNFYQMQPGNGHQEISSGYRSNIDVNKEGKENLPDFQRIGTFVNKFRSFQNQKENFIQKYNAESENIKYENTVRKPQVLKAFNGELHSFQDQRNDFNGEGNYLKSQNMYLVGINENPTLGNNLKNTKGLESHETNSEVQQKGIFGFPKAKQQSKGRMKIDSSGDNINKETKESFPKFQNIEAFAGKFRSFHNQNEISGSQNNKKYESIDYDKSSTKVQASKGFNNNFHSFQDQRNSYNIGSNMKSQNKYMVGINENPRFNAQYLKNRQELEKFEKNIDVQRPDKFVHHKGKPQLNWRMQNNTSEDIKVEGKSDSIMFKESDKSYENNQKNYIQSQIPKGFPGHHSIEINRKVFRANSLSLQVEGNQTHASKLKVTVSSILISLIILILTILLLSCCVFLIRRNGKEPGKTTRTCSVPPCLRRNPVNSTYTKYTPLEWERIISNKDGDGNLKREEIFRTPTTLDTNYYRKESQKFEALRYSKQGSINESENNRNAGFQSFSKGEIQMDIQNEDTENNSEKSDSQLNTGHNGTKCDSLESSYDSSSQKYGMHLKREKVCRSPPILDAEYYRDHSYASETSKSSAQESFIENETKIRVGNPWDWQLKNVTPKQFVKETQCETKQKKSIRYQNKSYAQDNPKIFKRGEYLKEKRRVKRLPTKYDHGHSSNFQKLKEDIAVQKQENTFFTDETLHGYNISDRENPELILKRTTENYPIKDKIDSPKHNKVVNVKTKSVISFHRTDIDGSSSSCELQSSYKFESNSTSSIFSAEKDQKITCTSVQSIHEMHFNESYARSQKNIDDRTLLERDISEKIRI